MTRISHNKGLPLVPSGSFRLAHVSGSMETCTRAPQKSFKRCQVAANNRTSRKFCCCCMISVGVLTQHRVIWLRSSASCLQFTWLCCLLTLRGMPGCQVRSPTCVSRDSNIHLEQFQNLLPRLGALLRVSLRQLGCSKSSRR